MKVVMKMKSIKKNFMYNTLYQLLTFILPLITTPYISRVLGVENVGLYSYSYSIAYYFVMLTMLGLNNYGNRTIAMIRDNKIELSKTFLSIYGLQLISSFVCIFFYIVYCLLFSNNIISWIMLLYVVSAGLDINWFFFGLEEFKLTIIRNTFAKLVSTICIFLFVQNRNDIYLYCFIMVVGILVSQILLWPFVKKYIHYEKISFNDIKKHLKPNMILFIPVIAVSLYKMMDKTMLGFMSGNTEVGYYESAEKITAIPIGIITALGTVMLPRISNLQAKNKHDLVYKYINYSLLFAVTVSSVLSFGICSVAKEFVPIYFGNGFNKCIDLFYILMPSCIFISIANVIRTQVLIPLKRDNVYIISVSLGALINLIINYALIPSLGSKGAAIGTFFAEAIVCIYQMISTRKEISYLLILKKIYITLVISFSMFLILSSLIIKVNLLYSLLIKICIGSLYWSILNLIFYRKDIISFFKIKRNI